MIDINTPLKYDNIYFYNKCDYNNMSDLITINTIIIDDISHDVVIGTKVTCKELIIYCNSIQRFGEFKNNRWAINNSYINADNVIIVADEIISIQLNNINRKNKLAKLKL
jgi:hypothetical protein